MTTALGALFDKTLRDFARTHSAGRWWVALSGGCDSVVLLDLLHRWAEDNPAPPLHAIHIHHGLSDHADAWAQHCEHLCATRGIPLTVRHVHVDAVRPDGLEASARAARYGEFASVLSDGDVLMQAHHADDQAETVLYRLLRGAGARGLAGIPVSRTLAAGRIFRPLLSATRSDLLSWAQQHGLDYVTDPSNTDQHLDRNYLRHSVMPLLEARWPGYRHTLNRAATLQRQLIGLLDQHPLPISHTVFGEAALIVDAQQSPSDLAQLLHQWLSLDGFPLPPRARLIEFARQVLLAAPDRQPQLTLDQVLLERWRDQIVRRDRQAAQLSLPASLRVGEDASGDWGTLVWQITEDGQGLPPGTNVSWRWRVAGEELTPLNGRTKPFKQLCQERNVPPWWRHQLPLLIADGSDMPVFAPALGLLCGMADAAVKGTSTVLKPVWIAPAVDASIEQAEPY